jgi:hypothetical protein
VLQEAALADLDAEMAKMQDTVAAAESRAATLENSIATAKDQLLRLNADFENFRRRAVSVLCWHGCSVCHDMIVINICRHLSLAAAQLGQVV